MAELDLASVNLEAIERFVVENDDLLDLEERIGRFNIFDALRVERAEIRHSNFLAWLLTPSESHGQGDLFLKAVLMDMLKRARESGLVPPLSPVLLDGQELHDVDVRREWRNIDLFMISRDPPFVIAIENKVDSGEHSDQLNRYEQIVHEAFAGVPAMFVFLAANGQVASDEDWIDYSYEDLHRVLSRVKRTAAGSLGGDVGVFLEHYLNLIGSRFMNDAKIEELCRRIYANHRRAIDLIIQHSPVAGSQAIEAMHAFLEANAKDWVIRSNATKYLLCAPRSWVGQLCDQSGTPLPTSVCDIYIEAEVVPGSIHVRLVIGPGKDAVRRVAIINTLVGKPYELQKKGKKAYSDKWTRLASTKLYEWADEDELPVDKVVEAFANWLSTHHSALSALPSIAKPV
jgi:hypothetical protein